jgi:hypothetical protein
MSKPVIDVSKLVHGKTYIVIYRDYMVKKRFMQLLEWQVSVFGGRFIFPNCEPVEPEEVFAVYKLPPDKQWEIVTAASCDFNKERSDLAQSKPINFVNNNRYLYRTPQNAKLGDVVDPVPTDNGDAPLYQGIVIVEYDLMFATENFYPVEETKQQP